MINNIKEKILEEISHRNDKLSNIDVLLLGTPSVNKELENGLHKERMGTSMQIEVLKDIYNYITAGEIKQSLDESEK